MLCERCGCDIPVHSKGKAHGPVCRKCMMNSPEAKAARREYYLKHREETIARVRRYYDANRARLAPVKNAYSKRYYRAHKEKFRKYMGDYYKSHSAQIKANTVRWQKLHPEKKIAYSRQYQRAHPERVRAANARYAVSHPEMIHAKQKRYRESHKERMREYGIAYRKRKREMI